MIFEVKHFVYSKLNLNKNKGEKLSDVRAVLDSEAVNIKISELIQSESKFMVGRFGSVELDSLLKFERCLSLGIIGLAIEGVKYGALPFSKRYFSKLHNNAGVYPINKAMLANFYSEMKCAMPEVDILASWVPGEVQFKSEFMKSSICELGSIEPYYHSNPWSAELEGKKVLVIHPFAKTIKSQYENNRESLFNNPRVLPKFNLFCLEAVQSIAGNRPKYGSWLEALEWMTSEALKIDFDVAIIGCGAYGFPLAARLKKSGRKVIHLGGATQILFGIKGKRWDKHPVISKLYNENWCYPSENERPSNISSVEGGCYW